MMQEKLNPKDSDATVDVLVCVWDFRTNEMKNDKIVSSSHEMWCLGASSKLCEVMRRKRKKEAAPFPARKRKLTVAVNRSALATLHADTQDSKLGVR
jgi:hypothetical protein